MNSAPRLEALRRRLREEDVAAAIIIRSANVTYITGMDHIDDEEDPHIAVVTAESAILYTDSRYVEVAGAQSDDSEWQVEEPAYPSVPAIAGRLQATLTAAERVAVENTIPYRSYAKWADALTGRELLASDDWVERIRVVKDADEISRIAKAQSIADEAWAYLLGWIAQGKTERECALELDFAMRRLGAEAVGFATIVASGPNGSKPHAVPGDRKLQRGDLVTFDFGAKVGGYHSDMTRTIGIGEVSDSHRVIYETVLAANRAGLAAVRAGAAGTAVDKAARDIIEAAGMGQYFGHGTGHGVGLSIHEHPGVSPRSDWTLEAGSVVTVEPGIYVPGETGARIEDLVVVTEDGANVLSASPRDLVLIDR